MTYLCHRESHPLIERACRSRRRSVACRYSARWLGGCEGGCGIRKNHCADEQHCLAFTFTRQAGAELTRRLNALGVGRTITTGTFHAVAFSILRQRWIDTGRAPRNVITTRSHILARLVPNARNETLGQISLEIDWCRARMIDPVNYADAASAAGRRPPMQVGEFEKVLRGYESEKQKRGVVDLDDLIELVVREMRSDRNFAEQIRWRFRHIHVDEGQDMNPLQYEFVRLLSEGRSDLFVVGDPCQSIYGWNGADPSLFNAFIGADQGVHVVSLPNNYRCSPEIVAAARHVLEVNGMSVDTVAVAPNGPAVRTHTANTADDEARAIAEILRNAAPTALGTSAAVLVRTNAQIEPIRKAIVDAGLTVRTSSFGSPAISEAMSNVARLSSLEALLEWAEDLRLVPATTPVAELVSEYVVQSSTSDLNGNGFQAWVYATGALRDSSGTRDGHEIEIMTFHAAKGGQWKTVIVAGFEKGFSPHGSAISSEQIAEEARLIYVALTRAEQELHITQCLSRNNRNCQPSPWLKGMPVGEQSAATSAPVEVREAILRLRNPESEVLDQLRDWRRNVARIGCTTEVAICSDHELRRIAESLPSNESALAELLGPIQARRHADKILAITASSSSR
jgi:DNA helicase II / ATP-dependent DNA helicase PcrA